MTARILVLDESALKRFWSKVDRTRSDGCWEWQGARQHWGHGLFSLKGRNLKAHRVAYEIANEPIAEGLIVRHRCDNPPCVNPTHLELGTQADNVRDRDSRGRHRALAGTEHNMVKLTPEQVREIRSATGYGVCPGLAKKFGVSLGHVYQLRSTKRLWKDVVA